MKTQSIDTQVEAEHILIDLLRKKSIATRFSAIRSLSQATIELSKRALARANREMDDDQVNLLFVDLHYGKELAREFEKYLKKRREEN